MFTPPSIRMIPSYLRNIKFQIYHSYLKHTLYPQPISCNMRRRTVHGPVILSKTYIITNAEHANAAYLCNDQKGALVTTVNHRSATPEAAIKWELEQLSNKKYTIKNVKTGTYAGVKFEDKNSEVVSHKSETQWEIYEVKNGNYSIGASIGADKNLYWDLEKSDQGTSVRLTTDNSAGSCLWNLTYV